METDRFDALTARLAQGLSRRRHLGALAAVGTVSALVPRHVAGKKKKKKCPTCPVPTTPAPAFCAGKNTCAQSGQANCEASGDECFCFIREDNAASICGIGQGITQNCGTCPSGTVCVMLGGGCGSGFGCVAPCPNPR